MDRRGEQGKGCEVAPGEVDRGGQRFDLVGNLNRMVSDDTAKAMPGVAAYLLLMEMQAHHGQHVRRLNKAHARFEKMEFNRIAPRSEPYVTPLRASRVRDADGTMRTADRRGHADHWSGQGGRFLDEERMKEQLRLSPEQMRALANGGSDIQPIFLAEAP
jgi:hypothetical protein